MGITGVLLDEARVDRVVAVNERLHDAHLLRGALSSQKHAVFCLPLTSGSSLNFL